MNQRLYLVAVGVWPGIAFGVDAILNILEQRVQVHDVQIRGDAGPLQHRLDFPDVDLCHENSRVDRFDGARVALHFDGILTGHYLRH